MIRWIAALLAGAGLALGLAVTVHLPNDASGGRAPDSPSTRTYELIQDATGIDPTEGYLVVVRPTLPITPGSVSPEVMRAVEVLSTAPGVRQVTSYPQDPRLLSADGTSALVWAGVGSPPRDAGVRELRARIADDPLLNGRTILGGPTALGVDTVATADRDLLIGELAGLVVLIGLLLWVFRGWAAAGLSVLGGLFTVCAGMGGLALLSFARPVSGVALNLLAGLGLGLSVDFGLLIVTRFREEVAAGRGITAAVDATVRTAGRTVLFSAATVTAAMSATLVYPEPFISSLGYAGMLAAGLAAAFALLVLPGMLRSWGHRIVSTTPERPAREGFWAKAGRLSIARPVPMVLAAVVVLMALAAPALFGRLTGNDPAVLPAGMESVRAHHAVEAGFPAFATEPAVVIVHGGPEQKAEAESVAASIGAVQGVKAVTPPLWTDGLGWRVDASLAGPSLGDGAREAVKTIRGLPTPEPISVAGSTAAFLDSEASLTRHLPLAAVIACVVMLLVFFLLTGSVVLPLKAVVLNLFTGAATAGLLVAAQLGPTTRAEGGLDVQIVVLLAALGLALVTDYGVFLLARVCELRRSGLSTPEAACLAMDRTGRTISAGAAIICVTFAGMSFGDVVAIRQLGMGLIIAVVLDVTVVRAILVPGMLTLLGRANWWAPAPLARLHRRSGADTWHGTDPATSPEPVTGEAKVLARR